MCLAQGPQCSDAGEARTRGPSVSSQTLYYWATALAIAQLDFSLKHIEYTCPCTEKKMLEIFDFKEAIFEYVVGTSSHPERGWSEGNNSGNFFSFWEKREPKYHFKCAIIGHVSETLFNGVMLAGRWWSNRLNALWFFRGFRPELVMKSIAGRGGGPGSGPLSLSLDSHMSSMWNITIKCVLMEK